VRAVAMELQRRGRQAVFIQPTEGGSMAAKETARAYEAWVDAGNPATLIGTESYATGLDLPGKKLTHLVLWSYFGMVDHVSEKMTRRYRYFVEEQRHSRVVQSIGRLIRSTSDTGEVLVSDNRFWALLKRCDSMLDRHLRDIPWSAYPAPR
jgi:Rad3-related DNA helicase